MPKVLVILSHDTKKHKNKPRKKSITCSKSIVRPKHVTVPLNQHWHLATEMLDRVHPEIKLWENDELKIKYKTDGSR